MRYVYRPVEGLLLVLITNKHSNIVEDLEMLRLFASVLNGRWVVQPDPGYPGNDGRAVLKADGTIWDGTKYRIFYLYSGNSFLSGRRW